MNLPIKFCDCTQRKGDCLSVEWQRKNWNKKFYISSSASPEFQVAVLKKLSEFEICFIGFFFLLQDEIFDMVKPKDPLKISLQDLINSNQGDTVTTILIDLNGFWTYENREALVANDNENSAELDDT